VCGRNRFPFPARFADREIVRFFEFIFFEFSRSTIFQFLVSTNHKFLSAASRIAPASALKNCRGSMARLSAVVTCGARARPRAFPRSVSIQCDVPPPPAAVDSLSIGRATARERGGEVGA
jgi:hypothetical protein